MAAGIDTARYPHAYLAPAPLQDQAAALNVQSILEQHHDLADVPVAWYWPRALDHPEDLDIIPAPRAGNRLTGRDYQQHWLSVYERRLTAAGAPPPWDRPTTSSDTTLAGSVCPLDPNTPADIQAVLAFALAQLGKPYVFGAEGPDTYDCSGLTKAAYHAIGIELPHYTGTQVTRGRPSTGTPRRSGPATSSSSAAAAHPKTTDTSASPSTPSDGSTPPTPATWSRSRRYRHAIESKQCDASSSRNQPHSTLRLRSHPAPPGRTAAALASPTVGPSDTGHRNRPSEDLPLGGFAPRSRSRTDERAEGFHVRPLGRGTKPGQPLQVGPEWQVVLALLPCHDCGREGPPSCTEVNKHHKILYATNEPRYPFRVAFAKYRCQGWHVGGGYVGHDNVRGSVRRCRRLESVQVDVAIQYGSRLLCLLDVLLDEPVEGAQVASSDAGAERL